jgi:hypothetical protein
MKEDSLYYILRIDEYPTLEAMLKKLENIFDYEIPFLSKVHLEKQKIFIRENLNNMPRAPEFLKMTVEEWGSGKISIETQN